MPRTGRRAAFIAVVLSVVASRSLAQVESGSHQWTHATSIGIYAGGSTSAGDLRPSLGGTAGWELSRWAAVESRGDWFERSAGSQSCGATINAIVNLRPRQTVTPFASMGFGLHHTSFDTVLADMPEFYRRRMGGDGLSLARQVRSFTDPAFSFGAGVDLLATRHLAVRPEVGLRLVAGNGRTDTVETFGVRVAYRFEVHRVTP